MRVPSPGKLKDAVAVNNYLEELYRALDSAFNRKGLDSDSIDTLGGWFIDGGLTSDGNAFIKIPLTSGIVMHIDKNGILFLNGIVIVNSIEHDGTKLQIYGPVNFNDPVTGI